MLHNVRTNVINSSQIDWQAMWVGVRHIEGTINLRPVFQPLLYLSNICCKHVFPQSHFPLSKP